MGYLQQGKNFLFPYHLKNLQPSVLCPDQSKMLGISLDDAVCNSTSVLYYDLLQKYIICGCLRMTLWDPMRVLKYSLNTFGGPEGPKAEFMQWNVDKVPDQSLLNTAGWRFIIPQLYKKYPKDDMNLNISLSSPPVVRISEHNIDATAYVDLIIDVFGSRQSDTGCLNFIGNKLGGSVKLNDFTMSLKWCQIGNLHMNLIQPIMWTAIQTVFLPYVNAHLGQGFPLPIIHGFTLKNGEIICSNSGITICSDVTYKG
ncbi:hypothetical protein Q3G72_034038 [Acer saccharum]|nr:hypothetical protein Q3G72_034038 [Acer saccharum]